MTNSSTPTVVLVDSLTKVLPDPIPIVAVGGLTGWRGETTSFQVVWLPARADTETFPRDLRLRVGPAAHVRVHAQRVG